MRVLGIRFCQVSPAADAMATVLQRLGMPRRPLDPPTGDASSGPASDAAAAFPGAIFPAGESWVELWAPAPGMPEGVMLQIVVDDADAFAAHARAQGLDPQGPMDAHGERIYFLAAPGGLQIAFLSTLR